MTTSDEYSTNLAELLGNIVMRTTSLELQLINLVAALTAPGPNIAFIALQGLRGPTVCDIGTAILNQAIGIDSKTHEFAEDGGQGYLSYSDTQYLRALFSECRRAIERRDLIVHSEWLGSLDDADGHASVSTKRSRAFREWTSEELQALSDQLHVLRIDCWIETWNLASPSAGMRKQPRRPRGEEFAS